VTTRRTRPVAAGSAQRQEPSPLSAGLRLGLLFGPSIFGVSAAGVALPAAAATLRIDPSSAAWILTVHALALGVGTAVSGRLADTWGVRRTLLIGGAALVGAHSSACSPPI